MGLKDKTVAVLVENQYQDQEVWYPIYRLREAGVQVITVGPKRGEVYKSKYGYPVEADAGMGEISAQSLNGIVIPGGYAPDILRRYDTINQLVKEVFDQGKLVAAICHAGWVLVSAKVLKGKTVTGFYAIKDDLINAGAEFIDREVARDGNLITSRRPDDLPAFCREILAFLQDRPNEDIQ